MMSPLYLFPDNNFFTFLLRLRLSGNVPLSYKQQYFDHLFIMSNFIR